MTKFHFRMATLLRLRETARDERRVQLAEVQRTDAELHGRLTRLDIEREQLQADCRTAAGPGAVDVARLVEAQQYALALRAQEVELQRQRQALATEIDRRRQALLESDRDVQTLEKLRQHQSQAHRQEQDRQEGKQLDEAALRISPLLLERGRG
jgi:flagellar export protein FliJ